MDLKTTDEYLNLFLASSYAVVWDIHDVKMVIQLKFIWIQPEVLQGQPEIKQQHHMC